MDVLASNYREVKIDNVPNQTTWEAEVAPQLILLGDGCAGSKGGNGEQAVGTAYRIVTVESSSQHTGIRVSLTANQQQRKYDTRGHRQFHLCVCHTPSPVS